MTDRSTLTTSGQSQAHREAWAVLPFFVNRTLDPAARTGVEAHLANCVACRAEVEMLRRVERGVRDAALETRQVEHAWRRLASERAITPPRARRSGLLEWLHGVLAETPGPARVALAAQATLLVAGLGALALPGGHTSPGASYETLSAAPTVAPLPEAVLRVRFADDVREARLRGLLLEAGLRIVDGPSAAGLYGLALGARGADPADALTRLRAASDAVRLIEVLVATPRPNTEPSRP